MRRLTVTRLAFGLSGAVVALWVSIWSTAAQAATTQTDPSSCPAAAVSQPFLFAGDSNWYTLVPGQSPGNFDGAGWTLGQGATITRTTLPDGESGSVLNLTAGSSAVSPPTCVQTGEPLARMLTRVVSGAPTNDVAFHVSLVGGGTFGGSMPVLGSASWAASPPVNVAPGNIGVKQVQFTFVAGQKVSDFQIYDFEVDPRMH